jgi:HSP20 family protein
MTGHLNERRTKMLPILNVLEEVITSTHGFDAWEEDDKLFLRLELAGYDKGNISVVAENKAVTIDATRDAPKRKYLLRNSADRFSKTILIPEAYDPEKMDATYENGVLTVVVEKFDGKKMRKIQIK